MADGRTGTKISTEEEREGITILLELYPYLKEGHFEAYYGHPSQALLIRYHAWHKKYISTHAEGGVSS